MSGWIRIHRKIQDHWLWKDPNKFQWWIDILMTVNHKPNKVNIGYDLIDCNRGQSVISLSSWGKRWGVSKDTARNFLKLLEKDNMITLENVHKSTRITVCKYDDYQGDLHDEQTMPVRSPNDEQTMPVRNTYTNNNDNKDNNEKNDNNKNIRTPISPEGTCDVDCFSSYQEEDEKIKNESGFRRVWNAYQGKKKSYEKDFEDFRKKRGDRDVDFVKLTKLATKVSRNIYMESWLNDVLPKQEKSELEKTMDEFVAMRIKIRKPPTDKAIDLIGKKLDNLSRGNDLIKIKILEQSIVNSWQDIYPLKNTEQERGNKVKISPREAAQKSIMKYYGNITNEGR